MSWIKRSLAAGGAVVSLCGWGVWFGLTHDLKKGDELRQAVAERVRNRRPQKWLTDQEISPEAVRTIVNWEDANFYRHHGVDRAAIRDAFTADLRVWRYAHGGSTITQQLARTLFLGREKTLRRKLREAILASRMEDIFSKDEILNLYLNTADWGSGAAGLEAASQAYCGKPANQLDWGDAALLAEMLANPVRFGPRNHPKVAERRKEQVLEKLVEERVITTAEFEAAGGTRESGRN